MLARDQAGGWVFRICLVGSSGRDAEQPSLRIDRAQASICVRLDPRNVIAHGVNLPTFKTLRGNQHREVCLAASARKRGGDISLLALWVLAAANQHVLGHPAFVARDVRSNAQRETFLTKQGVAAVARSERPTL